uniref:Uncharacterized protein n=1 Tax=Anopheles arabiensis TaxID=7173 RepID=A0A182I5E1_ANOAR
MLVGKLGAAEHDRYLSFILPRRSSEFSFKETIAKLAVLFDVQESLISKRYKCLQLTRKPEEDLLTYACRVNKSCVEFELSKLDEEQLKCLLFVCGLREERDVEVRTRLLAKIEDREQITLQQLHWVQYCGYKSHKCQDCGRIGHRKGHCNTANQKGKFRHSPSVETRIVTVNACAVAVN